MIRVSLAVTAFVMLAALPARAQSIAVDSGSHIRVAIAEQDEMVVGTLISITADSLIYAPEYTTGRNALSMRNVRSIDVSKGLRRSRRAMLIGAGIGALAGAGVTVALYAGRNGSADGGPGGIDEPWVGGILVTGGIVAGALIGARRREESWSPVYRRTPTATP